MTRQRLFCLVLFATVPAIGCKSTAEVVVYTSVDQVFAEPVFRAFEAATKLRVRAVFDTEETKSTGVVNRIIAEASSPQADVFWSGDPVRPLQLAKRGLVEPYLSPLAAGLPAAFRATDGTWTGIAARARVLLVNRQRLAGAAAPRSIRDLADPRWKGKGALANPLYGTTTMHAAALFAAWGDAKARAFFEQMKANGVHIASSNGEVKRLVASGEVVFGLADTDDAHEAVREGAPVEVVYPDAAELGTLVIPSSVVLLKGPHRQDGKRLVDHLLSADTEQRLAASGAHMPLRPAVATPPHVRRVGELRAMAVDYANLAAHIERLQQWMRGWVGL